MRKPYATPEQEAFRRRVANTRRQLLTMAPDLLPLAVAMTASTRDRLGAAAGEINMPVVVDETMPEGGFGLRLILVVSADGEVVRHG
jgi:hypothetical protein